MKRTICFAIGVLASSLAASAQPQAAATTPAAHNSFECDHDCLLGYTHRYMDALLHKDPSRIPLAQDVKFTENDVVMPIGEGIWATISSVAQTSLTAADTQTGNAVWFGTVEEHGVQSVARAAGAPGPRETA